MSADLPITEANRSALSSLQRRWLLTAVLYLAALLAAYRGLAAVWMPDPANAWLVWAAVALVVELAVLWWVLPQNAPPTGGRLLPTFGYGTALTLTCGLLLMLLAGFLFVPQPPGGLAWLPALLYTLARLVDYVDGYVARITRHVTKLGGILDMEFDGMGVLIAVLIAIRIGHLPLWYLPLAFSRQLFIAGIWLRRRLGRPVYEMTPSANRRIIAGYQTGFISVTLWPSFTPPLSTLAALLFGGVLTVSFLRDWLVVSGAIDPTSTSYTRTRAALKTLVEGWLPTASRIVGFGVLIALLVRELPAFPTWLPHLQQSHRCAGDRCLARRRIGDRGCAAVLARRGGPLGRVGRGGRGLARRGCQWPRLGALLFVAAVIVAHAGSGRWARWQPEEAILHRRPGEQPASEL